MVPRICIRQTPANDLYLLLSLLVPSNEIASLVSDPRRWIRERGGELRFLEQLARDYGRRHQSRPDPRPVAQPTVEPADGAAATHPAGGRTSILR